MQRLFRSFVGLLILCQSFEGTHAQRPDNTFDVTVMFSELHANAPVGGCGCFWMPGGVGEIAIPVWRNFSAVAEGDGQHTSQIPGANVGLGLIGGMGGLRLRVPSHTKLQPFGQALFGGIHGFDSYFPAPVGKLPTSYDTSFAMTIGGGVDIAVSKHIWIRALQADYYYSELRNVQGDRQNQFRLAAGIVFRGGGRK
jgi:outer membrane immunogenic protein